MNEFGYHVVSFWECEKPQRSGKWFDKKFIFYPHYIVFDFEALLKVINEECTSDLTYKSKHIPISVAISDAFHK